MTTIRSTNRWQGVVAVALFAGAAGVLVKQPAVLVLAIVGVAYATYPHLTTPPDPDLTFERRLEPPDPEPGGAVEVHVTVRNANEEWLPDLRIVDGVPPALTVVGGSPRRATALAPGERTRFSYTVTAECGVHRFEPATVLARDLAGAYEVETDLGDDAEIRVSRSSGSAPLRRETLDTDGRVLTDDGGDGIEFHRTRRYRHGDAPNRIDWKRFARTGSLTTVEYRENHRTAVVVCLDVRASAYRAPREGRPHAVCYGLAAAEQLVADLLECNDVVGIAALGREDCWLPPGGGADHRVRARRFLATHRALSPEPPDDECRPDRLQRQVADLRSRLDPDAQLLLVSPLLDGRIVTVALTLEAAGHAATVISPDVTGGQTPGRRLARLERDRRIGRLREAGVRVINWQPDRPLGDALRTEQRRWSA